MQIVKTIIQPPPRGCLPFGLHGSGNSETGQLTIGDTLQNDTVEIGTVRIPVTEKLREQFNADADQQYTTKHQRKLLHLCKTTSVGGEVEDNVLELLHHLVENDVAMMAIHPAIKHFSAEMVSAAFHLNLGRNRARKQQEVLRLSSGAPQFRSSELVAVVA